jgi:Cu(I)/Ag(I) efflux system membrane fusion protein
MNIPKQIVVAVALVVIATLVVVVVLFQGEPEGQVEGGMAAHDHSAMVAGGDETQPVTLTEDAAKWIGVTFATVARGTLSRTVRTVGSVTYDETRLTAVSPKTEGWVEELFVDFTGAPVEAGQPLLEIYSPDLVSAQEELLLARDMLRRSTESGGMRAQENARQLLDAARRRLAYWDIPEDQIRAVEEGGEISRTLTLRAPSGGIVVEKDVVAGAHIDPGKDIFRFADLSRVWLEVEVFEKDISLVDVGTHGMVSFEAYPGEMFHGNVTYVYPTVSPDSRTGTVRLELRNPGLKIRPGMFAEVELHLADAEETLLIPRSAVLWTGDRSVVFHRMSNGQLHAMDVVTGLSDGDQIQVLSGLQEGHVVVASATFLIDAESNLGAAMAAMAGMDHSAMDMGGGEMDHSQHEMGEVPPDTAETQMGHSGHVIPPDTAGG